MYELPQGPAATGVAGYKGFFYHFLDMDTGLRFKDVELSTDRHLAAARRRSLLRSRTSTAPIPPKCRFARTRIRSTAASTGRGSRISRRSCHMGWTAGEREVQHAISGRGSTRRCSLYILALGSPTHPDRQRRVDSSGRRRISGAPTISRSTSAVRAAVRASVLARLDRLPRHSGRVHARQGNRLLREFAPSDGGAARVCGGQSEQVDGLRRERVGTDARAMAPSTATFTIDGKSRHFYSYCARGTDFTETRDDGTIAPTAAGGSIAFAPDLAIDALVAMREKYGDNVFQQYGFIDAFNPTLSRERADHRRTHRPRRRLVRHRLPRHRPRADHRDDRELHRAN